MSDDVRSLIEGGLHPEPGPASVAQQWTAERTAHGNPPQPIDVTTVVVIEQVFGAAEARQTAAELDAAG